MKKLFLSSICFLTACTLTPKYDTEFKNPVFYQPLEPLGRTSTWTYLTPTSIKSMTPLDKNKVAMTGKCELVENEQDHITLLCDIYWHNPEKKGKRALVSFKLKDLFMPDCLHIEETYKSLNEEYPSISNYCVTPPDYVESEFD